ncbi:lasso RiPP family leader peptide-containing protein [bacterium]|nr:MAG: lasso RiPP family leader peptide-containing protein [bacterium]
MEITARTRALGITNTRMTGQDMRQNIIRSTAMMIEQKKFAAKTPEDRKAYHAPKLEDYGEVGELTQGFANGTFGADSTVFPYMYVSNP